MGETAVSTRVITSKSSLASSSSGVCQAGAADATANAAPTLRSCDMATVQVATAPAQAPDQPENRCPVAGVAVRTTLVPSPKLALQAVPQSTPTGCERTEPSPVRLTLSVRRTGGAAANTTLTLRAWFIVTVQVVPAPVQAPPQPLSTWPVAGVALSDTVAPDGNAALQVAPQSMPAGCDRSVPLPVTPTFRVKVCAGGALKLAVTVRAACMDTVHVAAVPAQSPPHPLKMRPVSAVAVRVTEAVGAKRLAQADPQSMPAGTDTTRPPPLAETESRMVVAGGAEEPPPPPPQAVRPRAARVTRQADRRKLRIRCGDMALIDSGLEGVIATKGRSTVLTGILCLGKLPKT
nr:hypothetical protein [Rhizobacter sp. AJA081-3]